MSTSNTLTKNDLKKVLEKISTGAGGAIDADCVIEQGKSTSGYWKWRKWNSGFVEAWYNRLLTISSTNTSIAVPSEITINTSKYWTCIVSGTGDGFIADVHHAWVKDDGTEVYVSATSSGNYRVSLYITYET